MLEIKLYIEKVVGVQGFEPWTPCSQSRCATRLRYTPTEPLFYTESVIRGKSCKIRLMVAYFYSKFTKQIQTALTVFLLLFCLLGTHWIGLAHSVSHAELQSKAFATQSEVVAESGITHSSDVCHLFDALTLAVFMPKDSSNFLDIAAPSSLVSDFEITRIKKSSYRPYQSQAPPTFIL